MIDSSQSAYYLCFALMAAAIGVAYIKVQSTEGIVITTKEFKTFQTTFLTGYSISILSELIAAASFYHTFVSLRFSLEQITKLYVVTVVSTTCFGVLSEIIDIGAKKDKCIISTLLFAASMFSVLFGGHFEMILLGRVVYGAASALHHSSFEGYVVHEHTSQGFPEDWLSQTFSLLTHYMSLIAVVSGVLGQTVASSGMFGCVILSSVLFATSAVYIAVMWSKDINGPRFNLSGFLYNCGQTVQAARSNRQLLCLMLISSFCEAAITIFTFYWAPWLAIVVSEQSKVIPFEIVFSTYITASMFGNYLFQLYSSAVGPEFSAQVVLVGGALFFSLGAVFQAPLMIFSAAILIQVCVGGYWPCIGHLRARIIVPELRSTALTTSKIGTLIISVSVLTSIHFSPLLVMLACASFFGIAAYLQTLIKPEEVTSDVAECDDEDL